MARPTRSPSPAFLVSLAALLALFHAVLGLTSKIGTSVTFDEIAHLTAGHIYNERGDFRFHPENGNLPQRWAALPMQWIDPRLPDPAENPDWAYAAVWAVGREFFYRSGNNTDFMIFAGRAMISLFSAATGLLIFFWARRLFGWSCAFVSLGFFAFSPTFLAHGSLATSDATMAFFFLAAVSAWWWQLERPTVFRLLLSSLTLGLACVAKFSAVLLGPMLGMLALLHLLREARQGRNLPRAVLHLLGVGFVHAAVAWCVIWAFYDFRFSAHSPGPSPLHFMHPWSLLLDDGTLPERLLAGFRHARVFPEAFIYGAAFVDEFSHNRIAFFRGQLGVDGWVEFFPFAFLVKTSLPVLIVTAAGLALWLWQMFHSRNRTALASQLWTVAPLATLLVFYWIAAIGSSLNIGHRHILPTYPVLFILIGGVPLLFASAKRLGWILLSVCAAWHVGESFTIRPHYLAYFNPLVGGPQRGYWHLVDSSLDWGQDIPGLSRWLQSHRAPGEPVYLEYFGMGDPTYEGIDARSLTPSSSTISLAEPWRALQPGLYCISATSLQQPQPYPRHGWAPGLEAVYQNLHRIALQVRDPAIGPAGVLAQEGITAPELSAHGNDYGRLRFQRLSTYLKIRRPEATIGYSIFVYRLTAAELAAATEGSAGDLLALVERAASTSTP